MKTLTHRIRLLVLALTTGLCAATRGQAQTTAFTCQGRLTDASSPATGNYDLKFQLFDAATAGNALGNPLTNASTAVASGLFTVQLDFGAGVFPAADRWLEIGVRPGGSSSAFTTLSSRQALTPTPYALFA